MELKYAHIGRFPESKARLMIDSLMLKRDQKQPHKIEGREKEVIIIDVMYNFDNFSYMTEIEIKYTEIEETIVPKYFTVSVPNKDTVLAPYTFITKEHLQNMYSNAVGNMIIVDSKRVIIKNVNLTDDYIYITVEDCDGTK